jgi:hypothetical protein
MLTKEISEVEELLKAKKLTIEVLDKSEDNPVFVSLRNEILRLGTKLSTLKSAQAKFNKLKQKIEEITSWTCYCNCVTFDNKKCRRCGSSPKYGEIDYDEMIKLLDELSSKQEEKE